jgi:hypothetical protein
MSLPITMLRALAHSADLSIVLARGLSREAADVALDRGLAMLAAHRPWRVVARPDYIMRYYLGGRMGHAFPEGTPAVFGGLGGTAYLHRIGSPDAGRAHHSHPWETAISIVLVGGYDEEVVTADGSIVTRRRGPGSIALITASTFHRISELHASRVWTLFITGPRTPDRAWYFRRPDGSIVHEIDYHANLEAEHVAEEAWFAAREAWMHAVPPIRIAKPGEGLTPATARAMAMRVFDEYAPIGRLIGVVPGSMTVEANKDDPDRLDIKFKPIIEPVDAPSSAPTVVETGAPVAPGLPRLTVDDAARAFDAAVKPGCAGVIVSPAATMPEAIAAMEPLGWAQRKVDLLVTRPGLAWRTVRLVDADSKPLRGAAGPTWAHAVSEDMLTAMIPLAVLGTVVVSEAAASFGPPVLASEAAAARGLEVRADMPPVTVPVSTKPFVIGPVDVFADSPVSHAAAVHAASTLKVPVVQHYPSPSVEKRLTFEDGSIAELLTDEPPPEGRAFIVRRRWRYTDGENMASEWARRDIERFEQTGRVAREHGFAAVPNPPADPIVTLLREGAGDHHGQVPHPGSPDYEEERRLELARPEPAQWALAPAVPPAPEGYKFEQLLPSPTIPIRRGDAYIGALLTNGNAVAHGRELRPAEIEKHAEAWAHARAMVARQERTISGTGRGDLVRVVEPATSGTICGSLSPLEPAPVGMVGRVVYTSEGWQGLPCLVMSADYKCGHAAKVEAVPEPIESRREQAKRDPDDPRRSELGVPDGGAT